MSEKRESCIFGRESLQHAFGKLSLHEHLCLLYETPEEQAEAVIPFLQAGLEKGEKCLYVADDAALPDILEAFRRGGIDTEQALASGRLTVVSKHAVYLENGRFDPDSVVRSLEKAVETAKADGFPALRVAAEMTWVLGGEAGTERLMEYEAKLNNHLPHLALTGLCQYRRSRFSPEIVRDVVYTHPLVVHKGRVLRNFHYIPPEEFLKPDPAQEV
ncbi:MAG: MEDS domain-containing protein [Thermodesulfovibrionales bacterium]